VRYNLVTLWRRAKNPRRREVVLREIVPTAVFAGDLFAAGGKVVVDQWTAALPRIITEYERTLTDLTQDAPADVGAQISMVENEISRLFLSIRLRLERWAQRIEQFQRAKWRGAVLSATSVDIGTMIGPGDMRTTLSAAIEENVALVRSVSDQTRDRISAEVFQGLRERKPAREVAAALREKVGMGRRRALLIASDQTTKLTEALNEERRREAGVDTWAWVSSHKLHYRPEHLARDGKRYDDGVTSGPHKPPQDRPGQLIHCGCTSRAVLSLDGEF
jgi:uncharacterized protein with gpF-like domain